MKKSYNKTAIVIVSGIAIGAAIGWFLFPKKRKRLISTLKFESSAISDSLKMKVNAFMSSVRHELDQACNKVNNYMELEKALNAKILKITSKLRNDFPELYSYIEEMPITIPDTNDPEINIKHLEKYYQSLEIMLANYIKSKQEKRAME